MVTSQTHTILTPGERLLWEGRPVYKPFVFTGAIPLVLVGAFTAILVLKIVIPVMGLASYYASNAATPAVAVGIFAAAVAFALVFLWLPLYLLVGYHIKKAIGHPHVFYAITDRRIIVQEGRSACRFSMVYFDRITDINLEIGIWDQYFGGTTGSIRVSTAKTSLRGRGASPLYLWNIEHAQDVYRRFTKLPDSGTSFGPAAP